MPQNQEYQLKKPPVQCPHCGRWFKHAGYYIRHDRDSIVSCITKINIAESDKKERERQKEITSNRPKNYYSKRYYEKHRETISQRKKEWYIQNAENVKARYQKKKYNQLVDAG